MSLMRLSPVNSEELQSIYWTLRWAGFRPAACVKNGTRVLACAWPIMWKKRQKYIQVIPPGYELLAHIELEIKGIDDEKQENDQTTELQPANDVTSTTDGSCPRLG